MTDSELKSCPCCGGGTFEELAKSPMGIRYYSVVCKDCGLSTKFYCEESKDKAYKAWNTRAKDPSHQLFVDALEEISNGGDYPGDIAEAALKAARGE